MRDSIFGKYIKEIREKKDLSQAELARRLGHASNSYVRDIERGIFTPPPERLGPLARALGVPVIRLKEASLETRLRDLDVKVVAMLKDYKHLTLKDKEAILKTYHRIKSSKDGPHR